MERIVKDPNKNYIETEPVFIADKDGNAHILRPANHDPIKEAK